MFLGLADDARIVVPITRVLVHQVVASGTPKSRLSLLSVSPCPRPDALAPLDRTYNQLIQTQKLLARSRIADIISPCGYLSRELLYAKQPCCP